MKTIRVNGRYNVYIGSGILSNTADFLMPLSPDIAAVVCDENVKSLYGEKLFRDLNGKGIKTVLISFAGGEKDKTYDTVKYLTDRFEENGLTRKSAVLALGGGVTGDVAGFAASVFLRGIALVHIPTTLIAQTDSAVGGKTGVDTDFGKNRLGSFYEPNFVIADTDTLKTLDERNILNGTAEIIKYAAISDKVLFKKLESKKLNICDMEDTVYRCLKIKAKLTKKDFYDNSVRKYLNFGHTLGHALEKNSGYEIMHGEAVAKGMAEITRISEIKGITEKGTYERLKSLAEFQGLDVSFPDSDILPLIEKDKKSSGGYTDTVLLEKIGKPVLKRMRTEEICRG